MNYPIFAHAPSKATPPLKTNLEIGTSMQKECRKISARHYVGIAKPPNREIRRHSSIWAGSTITAKE